MPDLCVFIMSHVSLTPHDGWLTLQVEMGFTQNNEFSVSSATEINEDPVIFSIDSTNLIPGEVNIWLRASGDGVYLMEYISELGMVKESSPPLISVSEYAWDGPIWIAQGQFSDPDGEEVSFSLAIDGKTSGTIAVSSNSWSTPRIDFQLWDSGVHDIEIKGCDVSGMCSEVIIQVNNTHLFNSPTEPVIPNGNEDTGKLPASSFALTIFAFTIGLIYSTRRN